MLVLLLNKHNHNLKIQPTVFQKLPLLTNELLIQLNLFCYIKRKYLTFLSAFIFRFAIKI